jgi:cell division cycle protein 37
MPLDYSKWDNLELSDDSDIEVHPNVDKRSFIKWKQESIHMEREQRRQKIEFLENETGRNDRLLKQLNELITVCQKDGTRKVIEDITSIRDKARKEGSSDTPIPNSAGATASFDAIMESLVGQIETALKTQSEEDVKRQLITRITDSRNKAQARQDQLLADLAKEQKEAAKKMTSDNMYHESFNKTVSLDL